MKFRAIDDKHAIRGLCASRMGGSATGPRALVCVDDGHYEVRDINAPWSDLAIPEDGPLTAAFAMLVDLTDGERLVRIT